MIQKPNRKIQLTYNHPVKERVNESEGDRAHGGRSVD
jgi:hypothetical protein